MKSARRNALKLALVAGTGALAYRSLAQAKPIELRASRDVVWKDFLGVNTQFMLYTPEIRDKQARLLKALGLEWVRAGLHWMLIEPQEGQWKLDWADAVLDPVRQHGLRAVTTVVGSPRYASSAPTDSPYVDKYPPTSPELFAQRLLTLIDRYPQVEAWQVWNEPNIPGFWYPKADPEGYARMFAAASNAMRTRAPRKTIVMAGMAYYSQMYGRDGLMLEAMQKLGAFKPDVVAAYHPYTAAAEGSDAAKRDFPVHAAFINTWLRAAGVKQIWATEWGWSSYDGPKEEQPIIGLAGQTDYTLKRLAMMAALDYDRIFLFTLADMDNRAGVRDRRYGLLTEAGEPKPVYQALAVFLRVTGPRLTPSRPPRIDGATPGALVSIAWRRPDGTSLWMVWADAAVTLSLPDVRSATLHDPAAGSQRPIDGTAGGVRLPVTAKFQMLEFTDTRLAS